jgi:protein TonB
MTTPSTTISVVALLTSMVLGVVLLIGALEIPVPALSIQIGLEPASVADAEPPAAPDPTPTSTPPPEPSAQGAGDAGRDVFRVGIDDSGMRIVEREDRDVSAQPTFTPYTVPPRILNREQIVRAMIDAYPPLLRDAGIGGTVRIFFYIDEDGTVRDTRIDQSSGHQALDDAALSVASVYRFSPALNRDRRLPVWVVFPITFQVR